MQNDMRKDVEQIKSGRISPVSPEGQRIIEQAYEQYPEETEDILEGSEEEVRQRALKDPFNARLFAQHALSVPQNAPANPYENELAENDSKPSDPFDRQREKERDYELDSLAPTPRP